MYRKNRNIKNRKTLSLCLWKFFCRLGKQAKLTLCRLHIITWKLFRKSFKALGAAANIWGLLTDLNVMLSVVAPALCGQTLWAFPESSVLFQISSLHHWHGNQARSSHTAQVRGRLSFYEQIHFSSSPLLRFRSQPLLWLRNLVSTVWLPLPLRSASQMSFC